MNNIEVFINILVAQAQLATKKPTFDIKVKHKVGMELAVEEEGRRKAIKARQKKNKRNKRRNK